jgi:hypothetical protein
MSYLFLSLLILIQTNWIVYESQDPAFILSFPDKIQKKEKIIKTDIGEIEIKTVYAVSSIDSTENELYLLNYYKLNPEIFEGDSAITKVEFFKETINNLSKELNFDIIYSNYNINNEISTATFRVENSKKAMKGEIVISNGYFYFLQVFTTKQYSLNKNMDKFLKSFYLK